MKRTENLTAIIDDAYIWAKEVYRQLHLYPELANEEYRSASLVEQFLAEIGLESRRPLETSVVAVQYVSIDKNDCREKEKKENQRVVFRAELDALRIKEETGLPFASCRDGYMHACGHDIHVAVILGTAMVLSKIKEKINVDVKYIFQQDEEEYGKGKEITEMGEICESDIVLGFHVRPSLDANTIGIKQGVMHGASRMFDIKVIGEKSHGARPHLGKDAVLTAANIVETSYAMVSRTLDPMSTGVISFGKIRGGEQRNVIPDEVTLSGIIRGETTEICDRLTSMLRKVVEGSSKATGCTSQIEFLPGYPPLVNDSRIVKDLCEGIEEFNKISVIGKKLKGKKKEENREKIKIIDINDFSLTVDDFAYYLEKARGAYFYLGSGFAGKENSEIHTGTFAADEECIRTGIKVLTSFVLNM